MKRKYIKIPPELVDGEHYSFFGPESVAITDLVNTLKSWWKDNATVGDALTFEVVEMTDAEFEAVPEV